MTFEYYLTHWIDSWQEDLFPFNSAYEANRVNALVESSLAGGWICTGFWLLSLVLISIQKYLLGKKQVSSLRVVFPPPLNWVKNESIARVWKRGKILVKVDTIFNYSLASSGPYGPLLARSGYPRQDASCYNNPMVMIYATVNAVTLL